MMKVIYIAGPFSAPNAWAIEQNIRAAEEAGMKVAMLGASPLIPHANTRYFHGTEPSSDPEFWYRATAALCAKSDAILLIGEWRQSKGALAEKALGERLGIPVFESMFELMRWLKKEKEGSR